MNIQEMRDSRKAEGLCIRCGRFANPGETQCEYCAELHNARNRKYWEKKRRSK